MLQLYGIIRREESVLEGIAGGRETEILSDKSEKERPQTKTMLGTEAYVREEDKKNELRFMKARR